MIKLNNISKRYPGGQEAVSGLDLIINKGEMVFITGHSGAGKSTLLRLIALIDRPSDGQIIIDNQTFSSIERGYLVFVCIEVNDSFEQVKEMTDKIINFRMLDGPKGITSRSLKDSNEEALIVSQFTLAAITNKGTKPSFHKAAKPDEAKLLYDKFLIEFKSLFPKVKEGKFGAFMEINLVNNGPVTFNFKT